MSRELPRPYTPARASPQSTEGLRMFLQQELDKIAQAFARDIEQAGDSRHDVSGETGLLLYLNTGTGARLERVELGAADSGGTGYRLLRVVN